jgi:hypothetical protein
VSRGGPWFAAALQALAVEPVLESIGLALEAGVVVKDRLVVRLRVQRHDRRSPLIPRCVAQRV